MRVAFVRGNMSPPTTLTILLTLVDILISVVDSSGFNAYADVDFPSLIFTMFCGYHNLIVHLLRENVYE
ncbi:hypothetical protein M8J76_008180 [Diaphorina citri]|nr:hypothetical protein M8J76_008180 [Diaphorina citri]KAI5734802.1 hypothetical protein M8J77_010572 [Diaphorina citri]